PRELDWNAIQRELELYDNPETEKQAAILKAAERLFAESGFADTPTAAIAREAGVTEKTLFKHFPTKADLFRRILIPILWRTVFPAQPAAVKKILREHGASFPELFVSLATDRWKTLREMKSRACLGFSELLMNDKLRDRVGRLFAEHAFPNIVDGIR